MEIKNKNIFLNLNEGEEIVYVAEKIGKPLFIFCNLLPYLAVIFLFLFLILLFFSGIYKENVKSLIDFCFLFLVEIIMFFIVKKQLIDYFYTDMILTNQRILISKFNQLISIKNSQVKRIYGYRSAISIFLISKKSYRFYFFEDSLKDKFKEVYPDYDDSKAVEKERKQGYIILAILLLLLPFFMYAEYKLKPSNNQNKSYKSAKHQHNSKEPYFDIYMTHLQEKIKSNWNPPKGENSSNVVLLFKVSRNGNVLKTKIFKSSNDMAVDNSALEALKKSEPLDPLPKEFNGKDVDIQFNFDYNTAKNRPKS